MYQRNLLFPITFLLITFQALYVYSNFRPYLFLDILETFSYFLPTLLLLFCWFFSLLSRKVSGSLFICVSLFLLLLYPVRSSIVFCGAFLSLGTAYIYFSSQRSFSNIKRVRNLFTFSL